MRLESVKIGQIKCDYLNREEFIQLCEKWLRRNSFHHIVTLNPEMIMRSEQDGVFRASLQSADIRVPDGAGLIWARWYMRSSFWPLVPSLFAFLWQPVERVTGVRAVADLARLCQENNKILYLLGGTKQQAKLTAKKLGSRFTGLRVVTAPDHYFSLRGPEEIIKDIKRVSPAVVLAAYGAPKQSLWIEKMRKRLPSVKIAVGVGGAFDIISENLPRAPLFLRRTNLEWLWRLYLEPRRMTRIWQAIVKFPLLVRRYKSFN